MSSSTDWIFVGDLLIKTAWLALVEILNRIEKEPYHWPVKRRGYSSMAYLATREGIDVASTIRNLEMLHWLKVRPDTNLPVRDEEAVFA